MFGRNPSVSDYYRAFQEELEKNIQQSPDSFVLEKSTEEILDQLLESEHTIKPIEIDSDKEETMKHRKELRHVNNHQREDVYRGEGDIEFEYEIIDVVIPLVENHTILKSKDLETSTWSSGVRPQNIQWNPEGVSFSVEIKGYGFKFDDNKVVTEVNQCKKHVQDRISWLNGDIEKAVTELKKNLKPFIEERKKKLNDDGERVEGLSEKLGIKLSE